MQNEKLYKFQNNLLRNLKNSSNKKKGAFNKNYNTQDWIFDAQF